MNQLSVSISRRGFLRTAALVSVPNVITSFSLMGKGVPAPSNRIHTGHIGFNSQGLGHLKTCAGDPATRVTALCDVDGKVIEKGQKAYAEAYGAGEKVFATKDFRELLARDDVDAVYIATPNHWHALMTIAACKAGKDVYCEKPESHTVREGQAMVDAARRYGRVVSGGSQRVWGDYNWHHRMVRGGAIGDVIEARVGSGRGPRRGTWVEEGKPVPAELDWDMWVGPAPFRPFNPRYVHQGGWHEFSDFGGGGQANWGPHSYGGVLFACGLHETGPEQIIPADGDENKHLTYVFKNGVRIYQGGVIGGRGSGAISIKGTRGECTDELRKTVTPPNLDIPRYNGCNSIKEDFLHCVRTRKQPWRDIEVANNTATLCNLGNIAALLGRTLKWDDKSRTFIDDAEANRLLDRPYRTPWTLDI